MKAGFLGTGSMGLPLASILLDRERSLVAFDVNPEATRPLAEKQARIVGSPAEVAAETDIVLACVPSVAALHAVVTGPDGVLRAKGRRMSLFVNLATVGSEAAEEAEKALAAEGVAMLDAPVTGGVARAWKGDITVVASGPNAVFDAAEPTLKNMAGAVHHVGEKVGQAQVVKVANNIMSFTNLVVALEALVMTAKAGIDPEKTLAVINTGTGQNSASLTKVPAAILNRKFNLQAPIYITEKDANLWRTEAERLDVPQTVASATYQVMRQAVAMGLRNGDLSELLKVVERAAAFELPKTRE